MSHFKIYRQITENLQLSNFTKIYPVGVELFRLVGQADGRTDGQIDKKNLIITSRNFFKEPKKLVQLNTFSKIIAGYEKRKESNTQAYTQ